MPNENEVEPMETDAGVNENMIKPNPNLKLAHWRFLLAHKDQLSAGEQKDVQDKFIAEVREKEMAPYYKDSCDLLSQSCDKKLLAELEEKNKKTLEELDAAIEDAVANLGESEVKDAWLKKAEFLCQIGDKTACLSAFRQTYDKTVGIGHQLDLVLTLIRVGLFYSDHSIITANLSKAKELMEKGGDWDRKNRLKAYEGLYAMSVRDFKKAAELFLDCVSTFTSYELMTYEKLIFYTVIASILTLERSELREKVIRGAEIQEQLHSQPEVKSYLSGLYDCDYAGFFKGLAEMELRMKRDRYLRPHYGYYTRAMRALAYKQLLSSYRSLTLKYMADAFGVTSDFIDKELHQLIGAGVLSCKIDKVNGIVETNPLDNKNVQYQAVMKHGDVLLNRIQKLGRVINV